MGFAYLVCLTLVIWTLSVQRVSSSEANATVANSENEEDADLSEMNLENFKERYRRLIPYMTYYVTNNYVNSQASTPSNYGGTQPADIFLKRPQFASARPAVDTTKKINGYQTSSQNTEERFIPSVQYDPKDIGGDNDYFTPVRYNTKSNYEDYNIPYLPYRKQRPVYARVTTPASSVEDQYYTAVRPLRPYNPLYERDYLSRKSPFKAVGGNQHRDYLADIVNRPRVRVPVHPNRDFNYPIDDFEPGRYNNPPVGRIQQPYKNQGPMLTRPPMTSSYNLPRNPVVNLEQITKSLQLTNRLPETLSKDNIDNSLKTLVEILAILTSAKKVEGPRIPTEGPPRVLQKVPMYQYYKSQYTRPKVITEMKYEATPVPIDVPEEPVRYKPASSYVTNVKSKVPAAQSYKPGSLNKVVEYYSTVVQNVDDDNKEYYDVTMGPEHVEDSTENTYKITEDLKDDILEDERLTLPLTTEMPAHNYPIPDGVSSHTQNIPPTSLKYGATRGKPNVDYPAFSKIPKTDFDCKEQRYKGFFGDPATGCQVWHYCDLNGGKSSFLCPNGTIFSQVALTCDWWFNVKCESTTQLYVLNERLYKYILPIMPKFPEDFSGPEVDRYLELKFKEMEAKLKEKKLKKHQEEKENQKSINKLEAPNDTE
ncbi:uncharacterized protein LOC107272862 [Cephus cinctus]|uniref:Uncharacterized protein LOC107272862 n=1 Tax=Cephus cinctus TaxID=211228 RepID=A0AAJ7CAH6_CEPCN|nr:uncharacterized protein LOC107272862 [Cephus cinctus]